MTWAHCVYSTSTWRSAKTRFERRTCSRHTRADRSCVRNTRRCQRISSGISLVICRRIRWSISHPTSRWLRLSIRWSYLRRLISKLLSVSVLSMFCWSFISLRKRQSTVWHLMPCDSCWLMVNGAGSVMCASAAWWWWRRMWMMKTRYVVSSSWHIASLTKSKSATLLTPPGSVSVHGGWATTIR